MDAWFICVVLISVIYISAKRYESYHSTIRKQRLRERVAEMLYAASDHCSDHCLDDQSSIQTLYDMPTEILSGSAK